jgi:hypothetical protein
MNIILNKKYQALKSYISQCCYEYPPLFKRTIILCRVLNLIGSAFWINLAFKNQQFRNFCYSDHLNFNKKTNKDQLIAKDVSDYENIEKILSEFGAVEIENFLDESEIVNFENVLKQKQLIKNKLIKFIVGESTKNSLLRMPLSEIPKLDSFSKNFSKRFYGESVDALSIEFIRTKCIQLPEGKDYTGEATPHIDKYIPALKMIYYPYGVEKDQAPFRYFPYTHKTNKKFAKKLCLFSAIENQKNQTEPFIEYGICEKNYIDFVVKKNTLLIFIASGLHQRSKFTSEKARLAGFISFYKSYNKFNLLKNIKS